MRRAIVGLFTFMTLVMAQANASAQRDSLTVYVFLSETCPICQSVSTSLRETAQHFQNQGVGFIGVFPSMLSTSKTRQQFGKKYKLPFPLVADSALQLTQQFDASVTPEVVVVKHKTKEVMYRGLIDNSFEAVGRRRRVVTQHYLKNSLEVLTEEQTLSLTSTIPVGCIIQK
jgi:peroxiredoxin